MGMTDMVVTDTDWSRTSMIEDWKDKEDADVARAAAEQEYVWIVNNMRDYLPGWTFDWDEGRFAGPYRAGMDPVEKITGMMVEASDYAVGHMSDEFRAEVARGEL